MWDIVWVSPQGHRSVSVSRHFLLQAPQCPCSMRKRFSRDHCCRRRSKPGCRIVGSHTRWELTTWADFQLCLYRLLMSTGCKSNHNGFSGCQSQQWWAKDISLDWPTVMFDDFLHQLVSGSLPSCGWRFNVGEHWKPWERCRTEGTRDETYGRVQLHNQPWGGVLTLTNPWGGVLTLSNPWGGVLTLTNSLGGQFLLKLADREECSFLTAHQHKAI